MSRAIRRKYTFRAGGRKVVVVKRARERPEHVFMKAFLWALYLPVYPDAAIEVSVGDRYKPDVVQVDRWGDPVFWAEAGKVGTAKIESLARRFRGTHFALAKWDTALEPYESIVRSAVAGLDRGAPFDLIRFPPDGLARFVDERGEIRIDRDRLEWLRVGPSPGAGGLPGAAPG